MFIRLVEFENSWELGESLHPLEKKAKSLARNLSRKGKQQAEPNQNKKQGDLKVKKSIVVLGLLSMYSSFQ